MERTDRPTTTNAASPDVDEERSSWFQNDWVIPTAIAAVPILVACVRLYVFACGDSEVFSALLRSTNLFTIWITLLFQLLVPLSPLTIPLLYLWYPAWRPERFLQVRSEDNKVTFDQPRRTVLAVLFAVALGLALSTWHYALIGSFYILLSGVFLLSRAKLLEADLRADRFRDELSAPEFDGQSDREDRVRERQDRQVAIFSANVRVGLCVAAGLVIFITFFTPIPVGIPMERIKVKEEKGVRSGYVLIVDDVSMTIAKLNGGIEKISNGRVEGRFVCPNPGMSGTKRALEVLRGSPPRAPTECDGTVDPYVLY